MSTRSQLATRKMQTLSIELIPYVMKHGDDDSVRHRPKRKQSQEQTQTDNTIHGSSRRILQELILYKTAFGQLPTEGDVAEFARRIKAHEPVIEPGVRTRSQKVAIGERLSDGLRDKPSRRQRRLLHEVACYIDEHGTIPIDGELGRFASRIGLKQNEDDYESEETVEEQEQFDEDAKPHRRGKQWAVFLLTMFSLGVSSFPLSLAVYNWINSPAGQEWFTDAAEFSTGITQNLNDTLTHWVNA